MPWMFFPDACCSVVAHQDQPGSLVVRSRLAGDIERILGPVAVEVTPKADYRFRATVSREAFAEAVLRRLGAMSYTNVKAAIPKADQRRAYLMNRIWSAGLDAQFEAANPRRIVVDAFLEEDPEQPDLFESRRRRDRGVAKVAGNTDPEWSRAVHSLCEAFIDRPPGRRLTRVFTAEDLRDWCENAVGQPHHPNAWSANLGGIIRSWKNAGLIEQIGSQQARRPAAHARLMRAYRVLP